MRWLILLCSFASELNKERCLNTFLRIVSTSKDGKEVEFISTMEGKNQKYKEP